MDVIRLFIIEDQPALLKNQIKLLAGFNDVEIVGTAMSAEEAISELLGFDEFPHVILCDLGLPKMSGIEATKRIKATHPSVEILIFTVFEDEDKVLQAIRAGASGYLLKGTDASKIHEAIVEVFHGGSVIQPSLARRLLRYFSLPLDGLPQKLCTGAMAKKRSADLHELLTIREIECLQMIAKGLSNQEVAVVLKLSRATIRTHLEHIYQKLEVDNRVEAIAEGVRQGIIDL